MTKKRLCLKLLRSGRHCGTGYAITALCDERCSSVVDKREIFPCLAVAKILIESWRRRQETKRPHLPLSQWPPPFEALLLLASPTIALRSVMLYDRNSATSLGQVS